MKRLLFLISLLLLPAQASAFCGFYVGGGASLYNDATQVVLMREGNQTVLSMQNAYAGPPEDFAMVVPVPQVLQKENVKTLDKELFDKVDRLSAPRLVEYWEQDPCIPQRPRGHSDYGLGMIGTGRGGGGFGLGASRGYVEVRAAFAVGEYDIVMLETNEAAALDAWLKANKYKIPDGAEPYFKPYVEAGMYFFVAKVDVEKVKVEDGKAVLSPLRFNYKSDDFSLPVRLGMINSRGSQDLLVYILALDQRYEVANRPNVTIPTNTNVADTVRDNFGAFYEALFSRTLEESPQAVVTEYAWQATNCDPCPTGAIGSATLNQIDFNTLGADVLEPGAMNWTLTRLHARYAPNDTGADLVFKKAEPIVGGRETGEGEEKTARPSSFNQFQGRYIMRHEWEGKLECTNPIFGRWGGPPDPRAMNQIKDVLLLQLRREALLAAGQDPEKASLEAPLSQKETDAIAFHMRREFGTSVVPAADSGTAPSVAPSLNTRGGAALPDAPPLQALIREPVLGLTPTKPANATSPVVQTNTATQTAAQTTAQTTTPVQAPAPTPGSGCSTATGGTWVMLMLVGFFRRRRN